jgi:hypothetical protein
VPFATTTIINESGAYFDGRSVQVRENGQLKDLKGNQRGSLVSRIEQAEPVEAD